MKYQRFISRGLLLPCLGGAVWSASATSWELFEVPRTFNLEVTDPYLRTDVEVEDQIQEAGSPSTSVTRQRILFQPAIGVSLGGWIYHPNLLHYDCRPEFGLDWQNTTVDPGEHGTDSHFLGRYHASMDVLGQKPYAVGLFADKDMTYRDYDFFSRVRVDSERYGVRSGYSTGRVPFTVSYQHYHELVDDLTRPTEFTEDVVSLNASHSRRDGRANTTLSYNLNDYTRVDDGFSEQTGLNQSLSLFDGETCGEAGWVRLSSLLNYNAISDTATPTDKLLIQENLRLQHTDRLASFYEYSYDFTGSGDSQTGVHQGRVGLRHQLYENLMSTFDVHGNTTQATSPGGDLDTSQFGPSLSEQYSRKLGTWLNLSVSYDGRFDRNERQATGQQISILDESHALSDGTLTFLNQPRVIASTIQMTDLSGTILYVQDLDYSVIPHGAMTEIRRIPGGRIPNGGIVLVDYVALLDPSGSYWSINNGLGFRLDFWDGRFALYGRWTTLNYSGADELDLRWTNDRLIGADSSWGWFRGGVEYEVMDSNLTPFDRLRLFQSANFQLSDRSTLSLDCDQAWTNYRDDDTKQDSYGFIARYQQRLTSTLFCRVEGGVRIDRGYTFDRDSGTARAELDWAVGKLRVKVGYEYGSESHPEDLTQRHYAYLRIRRTF